MTAWPVARRVRPSLAYPVGDADVWSLPRLSQKMAEGHQDQASFILVPSREQIPVAGSRDFPPT